VKDLDRTACKTRNESCYGPVVRQNNWWWKWDFNNG